MFEFDNRIIKLKIGEIIQLKRDSLNCEMLFRYNLGLISRFVKELE